MDAFPVSWLLPDSTSILTGSPEWHSSFLLDIQWSNQRCGAWHQPYGRCRYSTHLASRRQLFSCCDCMLLSDMFASFSRRRECMQDMIPSLELCMLSAWCSILTFTHLHTIFFSSVNLLLKTRATIASLRWPSKALQVGISKMMFLFQTDRGGGLCPRHLQYFQPHCPLQVRFYSVFMKYSTHVCTQFRIICIHNIHV